METWFSNILLNIFHDFLKLPFKKKKGITVNGQTIGDKKVDPEKMTNTYFGRFGIIHAKFGIVLVVTTKDILVSEKDKQAKLFWSENTFIKGPK